MAREEGQAGDPWGSCLGLAHMHSLWDAHPSLWQFHPVNLSCLPDSGRGTKFTLLIIISQVRTGLTSLLQAGAQERETSKKLRAWGPCCRLSHYHRT